VAGTTNKLLRFNVLLDLAAHVAVKVRLSGNLQCYIMRT